MKPTLKKTKDDAPNSGYSASNSEFSHIHVGHQNLSTKRKKRPRPTNRMVIARRNHLWKDYNSSKFKAIQAKPCCVDNFTNISIPSSTKSKRKSKKEILRNLPRPSDIVPDIEAGDASDAGLDPNQKHKHKRRKLAAALALRYLDNEGKLRPVPTWERENAGLQTYTPFMVPPNADRNILPRRAPVEFLSRSFRGCGLRIRRHIKRRQLFSWNEAKCCPDCGETSRDGELFPSTPPSSDRDNCIKKEQMQHQKIPVEKTPSTTFCKDDFIKSIVEEKEVSSSESSSSADSEKATVVKDQSAADTPVQEKSNDQQQTVDSFFDLITKNPGMLQNSTLSSDEEAQSLFGNTTDNIPAQEKVTTDVETGEKSRLKREADKSPFEKEKDLAMNFCQQPPRKKRKMARSDKHVAFRKEVQAMKKEVSQKRRLENAQPEQPATSYGSAVLANMGFRGRLGAREDGIKEAIEVRKNQGRSGLGASRVPVFGENISNTTDEANNNPYVIHKTKTTKSGGRVSSPEPYVDDQYQKDERDQDHPSLRDSDEYVTEKTGTFWYDNNRRGIIVDFDLFQCNAQARRMSAIMEVLKSSDFDIDGNFVQQVLTENKKDLSDYELLLTILKKCDISGNIETVVLSLVKQLDEAYSSVEQPVPNKDLIHFLNTLQNHVEIGILHYGSRDRALTEIKKMDLTEVVKENLLACINSNDRWPYKNGWKDALCRVGVQADQSLFLVRQSDCRSSQSSGLIVGSQLRSRTGKWMSATDSVQDVERLEFVSESRTAIPANDLKAGIVLRDILSCPSKEKRRRVLYLNDTDGLWHCGVEEFREVDESQSDLRSLVTCYGSGESYWVEQASLHTVTRANYRKLQQAEFPGLFGPEDLNDM